GPRACSRPCPGGAPSGSQAPPTSKQEPCSRAGELLDAAVARIRDVDVPAPVGCHALGGGELSVVRAVAPPGGEQGAVRVEHQDAVVLRIRNVDVASPVRRHALGVGELSVAWALDPPGGEESAARVELLDPAVCDGAASGPSRDVDVPAPIGRHAGGEYELSIAGAFATPGSEEGAARVELLDAEVVRIRDVDLPPPVGRHARVVDQFPARALAPPGGEEGAARVELLDALRTGLGDVDVPARIDRHAVRLNELPFALAVAAPGGEKGAARVELQDAAVDRISCPDVPALVGRHAEWADGPADR